MPLFMDGHNNVESLTAEAVAGAHQKDLEIQGERGADRGADRGGVRGQPPSLG